MWDSAEITHSGWDSTVVVLFIVREGSRALAASSLPAFQPLLSVGTRVKSICDDC